MQEIRIEVGGLSDLEPMLDLLEDAAEWLWRRGVHQWAPGSMRAQEPILAAWARAGYLLAARSGTTLVGGCFLVPQASDEWTGHADPSLYVHKLVVARLHAGKQLGHWLLAQCESRARATGVPRVRLDCWEENAKLRSYYRSWGYRERDTILSHGTLVRLFERELA